MCAGTCIYTKLLKMLLSSIVQTVLQSQHDSFELLHLFDLVSFNTALHTWAMAGQCFVSFKWLDSVSLQRPYCPYKIHFSNLNVSLLYTQSRPQRRSTDVQVLCCRFILPLLGTPRIRGAGHQKFLQNLEGPFKTKTSMVGVVNGVSTKYLNAPKWT